MLVVVVVGTGVEERGVERGVVVAEVEGGREEEVGRSESHISQRDME